ncbi:hypothetical protein BS78_07G002200 [Paspalum vaginatum]|nr:hypothetical protein BS78_07G002200 [Paspalum vaginatum]
MGVKNLWDILDSCKKKLPLQHLQNKKVCVDLSCWLVQLCSANRSPAFLKDKVYLKNLFHRIRALLALNCSLVFVTDGAIPSVKLATYRRRLGSNAAEAVRDGANSQPLTSLRRNKSSEFSRMIKEAKHLSMALGIPCLDGVEEAEAQCALLNFASLCDGCFTSDSDSFLFGARTVYRDVFIGESGYVICYEMEDIQKKLGFGRNSLISLAVLLGSDYSNGVHGFGPEAACRLVKSVGDDAILDQILSGGVKPTRKCKGKNSGVNVGRVDGTCPKASTCEVGINQDSGGQFHDIINAYLEPKCHSPDSEAVQRACSQRPFLRSQLQQICEQYFEWSPEKTDEYILPKIAERELRRFSNLRSTSSDLGMKPSLHEIPVPCPVLAIVKQRKVHGNEHYEVSWRNIDGLQVSVVPGDLIRSACPEKITEFLEKKDEQKKHKRRARPKKSGQAAMKDVHAQLQELLLGIESESGMFPCTANGLHTADQQRVAQLQQDMVDLSSPSPPIRASKIARSRKMDESAAVTMDGIDLQRQCLLPGTVESQGNTVLCDRQNSTLDHDLIDLSSPLPCAARKPLVAPDVPLCMDSERRALLDISNLPEKGNRVGTSCCKHETGASGSALQVDESPLFKHGTGMAGAGCSRMSNVQGSEAAEADMIDLSSPSLVTTDKRRNDKKPDQGGCGADSSQSPEHNRKARELRLFLNSIRDELY